MKRRRNDPRKRFILWLLVSVLTTVGLASSFSRPAFAVEDGEEAPIQCPDILDANTGSFLNTYYVPQISGAGNVPFTVQSLTKRPSTGFSTAWYNPRPTTTTRSGITYEWINAGVRMACSRWDFGGIFILYFNPIDQDGDAIVAPNQPGGGSTEHRNEYEDGVRVCFDTYLVWRDPETGEIVDESYLGETCFYAYEE
jgi:hypothetical protein